MKLKNRLNLLVLGFVLTITAVGCRTHPYDARVIPGDRPKPIDQNIPPQIPGGGIAINPPEQPNSRIENAAPNPIGPHLNWTEDRLTLKPQTLYFDFDKSSIKSAEHAKLDDVANYLKSNAAAAIRVEGNCDERGTEEYNRSLGERRALASREYLIRLGIDAGRIDTVSNGEDKPAELGHDEKAWSKNRRDEFVVLTSANPR